MKYDRAVKEAVLNYVEISDLVSQKVDLKRVGANLKGLCPFHNEKTPSFYVSDSRGTFHCFGCKANGNAIDFVMQTENMEFLEALESLADRYNIDLSPYLQNDGDSKDYSFIKLAYEMNREAGSFFHKNLFENKIALEYFEDRELNIKTIKTFGLGYALDSWDALLKHLKSKGYKEEDILKAGLASKSEKGKVYDRFRNRLVFPIFDYRSRALGFGARAFGNDTVKYLNSPESVIFQKSKILYGDRMARKGKQEKSAILVEGYMDLLQVHQAGFTNVLASMGTALTSDQANHISKRYERVLFAYDMDEAGRNAISRSIPILEQYGIAVNIVNISPAKDPDEYIKKFGGRAFAKRLEDAENSIKFKLDNIKIKYNLSDSKERYDYIVESIKYISNNCTDIEAEVYLQELSDISSISYEKILAEYKSNAGKKNKKNQKMINNKESGGYNNTIEQSLNSLPLISVYEKKLLAKACQNKDDALYIFNKTEGDFYNQDYLELFSVLMMYYARNEKFDKIAILEDLDLDSVIHLQNVVEETTESKNKEDTDYLLNLWTNEKIKIEIEKIDADIKERTFIDDDKSKIELRQLRKRRSDLLKKAYKNKEK